jgi:hypothetical protein
VHKPPTFRQLYSLEHGFLQEFEFYPYGNFYGGRLFLARTSIKNQVSLGKLDRVETNLQKMGKQLAQTQRRPVPTSPHTPQLLLLLR